MRRRHLTPWRILIATAATALVAGACGSATPEPPGRAGAVSAPRPAVVNAWQRPPGADGIPDYRFVATPDFLNQDVGDLRSLRTWHRGDPNSWTPQLQQGIRRLLDEIAATDPGSVLVPGDTVEGRWGRDGQHTGIFGPVGSRAEKLQAVRRAANFYYSTYAQRFAVRDLTVHATLGDHELGDNFWDNRSPYSTFKRRHIDLFKRLWADHFTRTPSGAARYPNRPVGTSWANTAYAMYLNPEVLLVSLDEFHRRDGDVHLEVQGSQLRWLRETLARARADGVPWIIVQGHNPILMPVREVSSSGGHIEGGRQSALWRTMARYGVDLYLNGEVHNTTMRQADGVTQICTGGLLYRGDATYMVANVYSDRIEFDVRELGAERTRGKLWQTSGLRTLAHTQYLDEPSSSVGSMVLTSDGRALNQVGLLQAYDVP